MLGGSGRSRFEGQRQVSHAERCWSPSRCPSAMSHVRVNPANQKTLEARIEAVEADLKLLKMALVASMKTSIVVPESTGEEFTDALNAARREEDCGQSSMTPGWTALRRPTTTSKPTGVKVITLLEATVSALSSGRSIRSPLSMAGISATATGISGTPDLQLTQRFFSTHPPRRIGVDHAQNRNTIVIAFQDAIDPAKTIFGPVASFGVAPTQKQVESKPATAPNKTESGRVVLPDALKAGSVSCDCTGRAAQTLAKSGVISACTAVRAPSGPCRPLRADLRRARLVRFFVGNFLRGLSR